VAILRPRARIVRTIGDQLISGPEAALIELVKNAFDADSPDVRIKLMPRSPFLPVGAILLSDRGHGMPLTDIETRWLEPATDEKAQRRFSPKGRRMLGAKGIGRFAASRLGSKSILKSVSRPAKGSFEEVLVQIDWDTFSSELYLDEVDIPILGPSSTDAVESGVHLCITDLRDEWTRKRVENLIRELRRLITQSDIDSQFALYIDLSDFTTTNGGFDGKEVFRALNADILDTTLDEKTETDKQWRIIPFKLQEHADYHLRGSFDRQGNFQGIFRIDRGDGEELPLKVDAPPMTVDEVPCGEVDLKLAVYDREAESIENLFRRMGLDFDRIGIRAARQILTANAGIGIFRHGFRIRPYGEPENDWLGLETQRVQDPSLKLGISQVSGRVQIQEEDISALVERSSREGLEHNGSFTRLRNLICGVLIHVEQRRQAFREKAGLSRKKRTDIGEAKAAASLKAIRRAAESLPADLKIKFEKAIEKDIATITITLEEIDEYQKLLQSRASLGLVVAQVIHEGRRILNPMATSAKILLDNQSQLLDDTQRGEILRRQLPDHMQKLHGGTRDLSRLFKRLDPVSGRRRGRPGYFDIPEAIRSALSLFSDTIGSSHIETIGEFRDAGQAYGYAEDFQAAALNILENAIHWLQINPMDDRELSVVAVRSKRTVEVTIENNGPPIDPEYIDRLFEPGFSLKTDGTGLGLSIAREACRASKGDLRYKDGANTAFTLVFPTFQDNQG
jgi:signal transduction histidine kinase